MQRQHERARIFERSLAEQRRVPRRLYAEFLRALVREDMNDEHILSRKIEMRSAVLFLAGHLISAPNGLFGYVELLDAPKRNYFATKANIKNETYSSCCLIVNAVLSSTRFATA